MVWIEPVDSIEELFEREQKAREAADARTQEWQKRIKKGDCFRQSTPYGFEIYGEVLKEYEAEDMKNYRFCHCFSVTCREGERGDVHVSQISALIDRETFETVKKKLREGAL